MKSPKKPFHCSDCNRDFQTKAALVAHENLSKVHQKKAPLAPARLIDPVAVRKLRDRGMPWREIAHRLGGVSLGGVRHAYGADKCPNHHAKSAHDLVDAAAKQTLDLMRSAKNELKVTFIEADGDDPARGILLTLQAKLVAQIADLEQRRAAIAAALVAFPAARK